MDETEKRGQPKTPCPVCKSTDWWWREPSEYGCGAWLCGKCHPNPNPVDIGINMPFEVETKWLLPIPPFLAIATAGLPLSPVVAP